MNAKKKIFVGLVVMIVLLFAAGCGGGVATPDPNAPKPSKAGDTGKALTLKGDPAAGEEIFKANCVECHGPEGTGGVENPGSEDGTVPALNPAEEFYNADSAVFAANLDLFIEHGSTPAGPSPTRLMLGYGDIGILQPQDIADVIAYIISLNQ